MTHRAEDPREHRKLLVAGVGYLAIVVLLGALSTAIYTKVFDDVVTVTLRADKAGLQLAKHGDVRYNGVLVGQVRDIRQSDESAVIELALEPASAEAMPRAVDASIMPTTLFGRKYVSLDAPAGKGEIGIPDGMVIPEDRVTTSVELGKVLSRLFPLLRAVRPGDLSATLNALATAVNGRGEQIGRTLEKLDTYLTAMNVHLPTLQEDLRLLASVAGTYHRAAPDLVRVLDNLTVTARTVTSKKGEIAGIFADVTELGNLGARILEDNEINAVRAAQTSVPVLRLLDKYSGEYNCLLRGIARYKPILEKTFEGGEVKQYAEFPTTQRRGYDQRDRPEYADKRGPRCYGMPQNPWEPWPGVDMRNGTDLDSGRGAGESYFPAGAEPGPTFLQDLVKSLTGQPIAYRGTTPQERRSAAATLSAETGRSASTIPTLSTLMFAPMASGSRT